MPADAQFVEDLKAEAHRLGFELAGITPATAIPEVARFGEWLASGLHGGPDGPLRWIEQHAQARFDLSHLWPNARSMVVVGLSYNAPNAPSSDAPDPQRGWISRYAWGADYHREVRARLDALLAWIRTHGPAGVGGRTFVDTGPIMEKAYAEHAGLGWIGKNTCLISPTFGSFVFLGEIVLDADLPGDLPGRDACGTCTRCIDVCPTHALDTPYVLDATRCISTWTIEARGTPPPEPLRDGIGHHLFGCDLCQEVCPWNRRAPLAQIDAFVPREGLVHPELASVVGWLEGDWAANFGSSPRTRARPIGWASNVLVAAGASRDPRNAALIDRLLALDGNLLDLANWARARTASSKG